MNACKVKGYEGVAWNVLGPVLIDVDDYGTLCCCNSPESGYYEGDVDSYDPSENDCDHASEMCWFYSEQIEQIESENENTKDTE